MTARPRPQAVATDQAPSPAGPYSQAVRAGDYVFCAGQTPRAPDGTRLTGAPFVDQARQVFENLRQIAQAAEAELADVVKLTAYLSDPADVPVFNQVCTEYLRDPLPARTTVFCQLPGGATVEVEAVFWVPGREQPAGQFRANLNPLDAHLNDPPEGCQNPA